MEGFIIYGYPPLHVDMVEDDNQFNKKDQTRRQCLKIAAAGAFGLTSTGVASAQSSHRSIPFVMDGDEVVKEKTVPADWIDQSQRAQKAAKQAKSGLLNHPAVESVGVGTLETRVSGLRKQSVEVIIDADADRTPSIPDKIGGIKVNIMETSGSELFSDTQYPCYDQDVDSGGLSAGLQIHDSNAEPGAITTRVSYPDGSSLATGFLTVRHIVAPDPCSTNSTIGADIFQHGDKCGEVVREYTEHDAVIVETNGNYHATDNILDESRDIDGYLSESAVSYLASLDDDEYTEENYIHGRGPASCQEDFVIDAYDHTQGCFTDVIHYDSSEMMGPGDSGGPFYWIDSYEDAAAIAGPITGGIEHDCGSGCTDERAVGSASYAMYDNHSIRPY